MAQHRNALPTCVSYRRPEVSRRDYILSFFAVFRHRDKTAEPLLGRLWRLKRYRVGSGAQSRVALGEHREAKRPPTQLSGFHNLHIDVEAGCGDHVDQGI
jgi:hypothetical protein